MAGPSSISATFSPALAAAEATFNPEPGDLLLLDNVRMLDDEENEQKAISGESTIVKALMPLADIFVNDAFSVSHRAHASVIGFASLPSCFGRLMESELKA